MTKIDSKLTKSSIRRREVGLLCDEETLPGCLHGLTDMLSFAQEIACSKSAAGAAPVLRISHWSSGGKSIERTFDTQPKEQTEPEVLILTSTKGVPAPSSKRGAYVDWLRSHHASGGSIAAVCGGVFRLAETGLLDGRRATTHWQFSDELQRRFPRVLVQSDRMLIDHGDLLTAGGVMAWTDMGLHLVERLLGQSVMFETARFMLLDPPRREQCYYAAFLPKLLHSDTAIITVQKWMHQQTHRALTIDELAARARLEPRTFLRRFCKATGMRPTEYHLHVRLSRARELLELSSSTVDQVASAVGYEYTGGFGRVFKKVVGLTPSEYRKRFAQPSAPSIGR